MSLMPKNFNSLIDHRCLSCCAISLCLALITGRARTAEFVGVGPSAAAAPQVAVRDFSADGSTIIGLDYEPGNTGTRVLYSWTREGGKSLIEKPANLHASLIYSSYVSADGRVVVAENIDRTVGGEPDGRGAVWTNVTGWQFPYPEIAHQLNGPQFLAVSADGSTAVGTHRALRWTASGGFDELGTLPGHTRSDATDVSGDGGVIVGISGFTDFSRGQLFRWTTDTGMVAVADLPAGHDRWQAPNVTEDGMALLVAAHRTADSMHDVYRWNSQSGLVPIIPNVPFSQRKFLHISDNGSAAVAPGSDGLQRWTEQAGLQILPHLHAGANLSYPLSMSADGSIIFGASHFLEPGQPNPTEFQVGFWTADGIVKTFQQVLQEQGLGNSIQGWQFPIISAGYESYFLSADGRVLAGPGINPDGLYEPFVVYLDPLVIPEPTSAALGLLAMACLIACLKARHRRALPSLH